MKTDTQIRQEGMQALIDQLGLVEAERFVALINQDSFDYTTWRQSQLLQETVESLADKARALRPKEHCASSVAVAPEFRKGNSQDKEGAW